MSRSGTGREPKAQSANEKWHERRQEAETKKEEDRGMLERYIHFTNKVLKAMAKERRKKSETKKMEKAS